MSKKVIDISSYNGTIDFAKVKNAGIDGVIMKIIKKDLTKDNGFDRHYKGVIEKGLKWGVYNYSYATTEARAKSDMKIVCDILDKLDKTNFVYGIWFDIEDSVQAKLSKTKIAAILNAAYEYVTGRGYEFGIYTGMSYLDEHINQSSVKCKRWWIARYVSKEVIKIAADPAASKKPANCKGTMLGWQYTEKGYIADGAGTGNSNHFDFSLWYGDEMSPVERLTAVAENEVGYLEKRSNSNLDSKTANAGKNNYTKFGAWLGANGDYWCAAFLSWLYYMAFGTDMGKKLLCGAYSAACETIRQNFIKKKQYHTSDPKIGDVIFFSGSRHSGANHIGHVYKVAGGKVYTIEGNTSGASGVVDNGGGVARKSYAVSNSKILGYGRPDYSLVGGTATVPSASTTKTSSTPTKSTVIYYEKYTGKSISLVDALKMVGVKDTSFTYRNKIAVKNGISKYSGTAAQNTKLLNLLKKGKLVKV